MATIAIRKVVAAGTISGNQPKVITYAMEAASKVQGGDYVSDADFDGLVNEATSPSTAAKDKLGFAIHDADSNVVSGWVLGAGETGGDFGGTFGGTFMGSADLLKSIEGTGLHIVAADSDNLFEITLLGVFALAQLGAVVGFAEDASGFWVADDAGMNNQATVIGFLGGPDKGVVGDTQVRVIVRCLNAIYLLGD